MHQSDPKRAILRVLKRYVGKDQFKREMELLGSNLSKKIRSHGIEGGTQALFKAVKKWIKDITKKTKLNADSFNITETDCRHYQLPTPSDDED